MMRTLLVLLACSFCFAASPQSPAPDLTLEKVNENLAVFRGPGGNMGLYKIGDATVVVDAKYAPLHPDRLSAIRGFSKAPVKYVINTHWHWDHVGGNEGLAATGATIVAHRNVRKRMGEKQVSAQFKKTIDVYPTLALPTVAYDNETSLFVGDEEIRIKHFASAHTDSDSVVHFKLRNVFQTGDVFFAGAFPVIDLESGGSIDGVIATVNWIVSEADDKTIIVPGHGPIAHKKDLIEYRDMLKELTFRVAKLKKKRHSLQKVLDANITKDFDARFGGGHVKGATLVTFIFNSKSNRV